MGRGKAILTASGYGREDGEKKRCAQRTFRAVKCSVGYNNAGSMSSYMCQSPQNVQYQG